MRWLITTKINNDHQKLMAKLSKFNCYPIDEQPPIPLGDDEQVIEVEGSPNLSQILDTNDEIIEINPSSEMTLY